MATSSRGRWLQSALCRPTAVDTVAVTILHTQTFLNEPSRAKLVVAKHILLASQSSGNTGVSVRRARLMKLQLRGSKAMRTSSTYSNARTRGKPSCNMSATCAWTGGRKHKGYDAHQGGRRLAFSGPCRQRFRVFHFLQEPDCKHKNTYNRLSGHELLWDILLLWMCSLIFSYVKL